MSNLSDLKLKQYFGENWKSELLNLAVTGKICVKENDQNYVVTIKKDKERELVLDQDSYEYDIFSSAIWELPRMYLLEEFALGLGVPKQFFEREDKIVDHILYDDRFKVLLDDFLSNRHEKYEYLEEFQKKTPIRFGGRGGDEGTFFNVFNTILIIIYYI